jgi:hypothetical protein
LVWIIEQWAEGFVNVALNIKGEWVRSIPVDEITPGWGK